MVPSSPRLGGSRDDDLTNAHRVRAVELDTDQQSRWPSETPISLASRAAQPARVQHVGERSPAQERGGSRAVGTRQPGHVVIGQSADSPRPAWCEKILSTISWLRWRMLVVRRRPPESGTALNGRGQAVDRRAGTDDFRLWRSSLAVAKLSTKSAVSKRRRPCPTTTKVTRS